MERQGNLKEEKRIFVIGPTRMQNELLVDALNSLNGSKCQSVEKFRDIRNGTNDMNGTSKVLLLWDIFRKDTEGFFVELAANKDFIESRDLLCLFNVDPALGIEESAVSQGIRGFFYEKDTFEHLQKGIFALFSGEMWLSRKIMTKCLLKESAIETEPKPELVDLTSREVEILHLLSSGASNETIAEELYISPHTVKTHVYNVFKKIGAPNRLQAALWAVKHLKNSTGNST